MTEIRMPDINSVTIAGNLTRDPAFRKTTNGTPVANFWIASNRKFKDNTGQWRENVCYVGVVAWYKLAENCAENLKKGCAVIIEGELQSRTLRNEDGRNRSIVEIKAHRVQFLNKKEQPEPGDDSQERSGTGSQEESQPREENKLETVSGEKTAEQPVTAAPPETPGINTDASVSPAESSERPSDSSEAAPVKEESSAGASVSSAAAEKTVTESDNTGSTDSVTENESESTLSPQTEHIEESEGSVPPENDPKNEGSAQPESDPKTEGSAQPENDPKTEGSGHPESDPKTEGSAQPENEPEKPNPNSGKFDFGYQDYSV